MGLWAGFSVGVASFHLEHREGHQAERGGGDVGITIIGGGIVSTARKRIMVAHDFNLCYTLLFGEMDRLRSRYKASLSRCHVVGQSFGLRALRPPLLRPVILGIAGVVAEGLVQYVRGCCALE